MYDVASALEAADIDEPAIVGTSPAGTIKYWTPSATALYGRDFSGAIRRNISEFVEWDIASFTAREGVRHPVGEAWIRFHRTPGRRILRTTVSSAVDPDGDEETIYCSTPAAAGVEPDGGEQPALVGGGFGLSARCTNRMVIECISAAVSPTFGLPARDLIGTRLIDRVHPDDRGTWEEAWERALGHPNQPIPAEVRGRTGDGGWRILSSEISNRLASPTVSAVVINSRDVTDQRAAEAAATAAKMTLTSVLESMGRGIWVIDPSGATVFANTPMTQLLGVEPDLMAQYSIHDLWDRALSSVPEQRKPGMRSDYELPITRSDGPTRWLRFHAVPRHNQAGEFTGSLLMCSDVTDAHEDRSNGGHRRPDGHLDGTTREDDLDEQDQVRIVSRPDLMKALANQGLTQREFDIVDRLIRGDRVPVIASTLFVSQSTIRNQLASVFRKIGVHSQQELIAYIRRSWH